MYLLLHLQRQVGHHQHRNLLHQRKEKIAKYKEDPEKTKGVEEVKRRKQAESRKQTENELPGQTKS